MKRFLQLGLVILIIFPLRSFAVAERLSLKTALEKDMISIVANASGQSYNAKGLHLKLTNKTAKTLQLNIDPALIFKPIDTTYQDLVLAGETSVALAPNAEGNVDLQSFCGKSYASAPAARLEFRFAHQGDSTLIKVVQFINKYKLYNGTGQAAIWALTNHHNLDGVYDSANTAISNKLVALMAGLTGWPIPDYFKYYKVNTVAGEPVLEARVLKIYAVFDWKLTETRALTMGIYNSNGKLIQPVIEKQDFLKGGYKLTVTFEAAHIAPGNYYIRLLDGTTLVKEKMVVLD